MNETAPERSGFWSPGRIAAGMIVFGLAAFWIIATLVYFGDNPDRLDDRTWADATEVRCADARSELASLPQAREAATPSDRAEQIDAATAVLQQMVDDIGADPPAGEDGELVGAWLGDWQIYLGDRDAHAAILRGGEDVRFMVSEVDGVQVTEIADQFARNNDMPSCETPLDIS